MVVVKVAFVVEIGPEDCLSVGMILTCDTFLMSFRSLGCIALVVDVIAVDVVEIVVDVVVIAVVLFVVGSVGFVANFLFVSTKSNKKCSMSKVFFRV